MDLDQQSSLSRTYGVLDQEGTVNSIFAIYDEKREALKIHHVKRNIDLIAGSTDFDKVQERLATVANKDIILFQWLQHHFDSVVDKYDYMIIDCHPDLGIATKNAIVVSDAVFSPVTPNKYSYDSISELETRMKALKREAINPVTEETLVKAKIYFLANMIRHNTGVSRDFLETIQKEKKEGEHWITQIPEREIFNRSTYYQIPVCEMERISKMSNSDLTSNQKNDEDFMKKRNYFARQKAANYKQIDQIFADITKYA